MDRFDPFVKYSDIYGDVINWEKDPMNKPQNQNKYFFSDGKTYYEQICKMLKLMSVFKDAFNQIYDNEDEISSAWENFVNNLSATAVYGEEADVELTWTDTSVNFAFTIPGGEDGVGISSITFNSDYTMTITLTNGQTYTSTSLRGPQGVQGEPGAKGEQGPQGEPGAGLELLDVYTTLQELQTAHPTGTPGDAYQVGTAPSFTLYIWSASQNQWVPAGTLGSVSPSLSNPLMDGTASPGSSDQYSRGDHVHPTDTSRASVSDLNDLSDVINESMILTDQEFTYRQSPAEHDGLANIDKIKGNTLVFNQLVQNGNFADTSFWQPYAYKFDFSVASNKGTFTTNGSDPQIRFPISTVNGHKYLYTMKMENVSNVVSTYIRAFTDFSSSQILLPIGTSIGQLSIIFTANDDRNILDIRGYRTGNTILQTGDAFTLSNVMLIDLTQMFGAGNEPATVEEFTSLFPLPYYNYNSGSLLSFNGTGLKTENSTQSENNTLSLPISTYFPTGMKSVGTVYDELTSSKAIIRIGVLDLGSVDWTPQSTSGSEYRMANLNVISALAKRPTSSSVKANLLCAMYSTITADNAYLRNKGISLTGSGAISIYDPSYNTSTSADAFKQAMSGVYLFYELATPTEQDIDIELTYFINNDGTEQILPINTATPTTSPILCDMTYMSISDEILYLYNNSGSSPDIEQLENDVANIKTQIGSESSTPMTGILGRVNTLESDVTDLGSDVTNLETAIGSEATTPKTGILGRVNALESDVSAIETEIGSDATTPMSGLAGRIKTIENALNNLKGKVVYEYTSTSTDQGLTTAQLDMSDLNNATHIEVIYSKVLNGNTTLSTGIIPYKFYDPSSVAIAGTIDDNQMDQNRERSWGISSTGLLTINSCRTYYPDSPYEVTNSYLIIRQVVLYKFTRANNLI